MSIPFQLALSVRVEAPLYPEPSITAATPALTPNMELAGAISRARAVYAIMAATFALSRIALLTGSMIAGVLPVTAAENDGGATAQSGQGAAESADESPHLRWPAVLSPLPYQQRQRQKSSPRLCGASRGRLAKPPIGPDWAHEIKHDATGCKCAATVMPCACSRDAATTGLPAVLGSWQPRCNSARYRSRATARPSSAAQTGSRSSMLRTATTLSARPCFTRSTCLNSTATSPRAATRRP
jgi:hypothetical protein